MLPLTRRPHHRSLRLAALALSLFVLVLASALLSSELSATGAKQASAALSSPYPTSEPTLETAPTVGYPFPPTPTPTPVPKPILLTDPVQDPHSPGVVWFPSTGHTLRGPFLDYWTNNGGLAQFGYPLTEEFVEPAGGVSQKEPLQVQYFERARFEYHPQNQPPYTVLLATLGTFFHPPDPRVPAKADPQSSYFPETGHNLSGVFKEYWLAHGGLPIYGYPITEQLQEKSATDGREYTVQYFERARMEYHPENAGTPYEVLLGMLGTQLSQKNGYPYGWYPLFGHAVDFSWVSGNLRTYDPPNCMLPNCGCAVLRYGIDEVNDSYALQLNGPKGGAIYIPQPDKFLVFFGRLAQPGETVYPCGTGGNNHLTGYFRYRYQFNPPK